MSELSAALLAVVAALGFVLLPLLFVGAIVVLVKLARRFAPREPAASTAPPRPAVAVPHVGGMRQIRRPARLAHGSSGNARAVSHREALAVWRYRQLLQLDVDPVSALGASLVGIDTAAVRSLTERGCPPALAVEIVAPAEELVPAHRPGAAGAVRPSRRPGSPRR